MSKKVVSSQYADVVRQGDVCLAKKHTADPSRAENATALLRNAKNQAVLALGEVTGHSHTVAEIDSRLVGWYVAPEGYQELSVGEEAAIVHEEHGKISLQPGEWIVLQQREESLHQGRVVID